MPSLFLDIELHRRYYLLLSHLSIQFVLLYIIPQHLYDSFNKTAEVYFFLKGLSANVVLHAVEACCLFWEAERRICSTSQLLTVKRKKQIKCNEKNVTIQVKENNVSQVKRMRRKDSAGFMCLNTTVLYKPIFMYIIKMLLEKIRNVSWCRGLTGMYPKKD